MQERECDYCLKQFKHGGKCAGKYSLTPCLLYERDPKGKWESAQRTLEVDFDDKPPVEGDNIDVIIDGISKTIKIYRIVGLEWNYTGKGLRGIKAKIDLGYWSEQNGIIVQKPKLKIIRCQEGK